MTYLLIAILLFGLAQSLLELEKESRRKKIKSIIKKTLAGFYILSFIAGVIIIFFPDKQSKQLNTLIDGVTALTAKVNSNTKIQIDSLTKLKKSLEDLNQSLNNELLVNEDALKATQNVSSSLARSDSIKIENYDERLKNTYDEVSRIMIPLFFSGYSTTENTPNNREKISQATSKAISLLSSEFDNPILNSNNIVKKIWHNYIDTLNNAFELLNGDGSMGTVLDWYSALGQSIVPFYVKLNSYWGLNNNSFKFNPKNQKKIMQIIKNY